ncbi:unnamed protein product [Boreogadus saida]
MLSAALKALLLVCALCGCPPGSLKDPPHTRDWTTVEVGPLSCLGTLRRSLDQLEEKLNMEMKKLRDDAELKRVQQYEADVTLDPDTAHPKLILSEDGKQVHDGGAVKKLLDNPKRFEQKVFVLRMQSFSSGRIYFEKVGVFVDYDEGVVSFYDVEARVHIYSATGCTFTEPLYPILCPGRYNYEGKNSAPLIISPVNQTNVF